MEIVVRTSRKVLLLTVVLRGYRSSAGGRTHPDEAKPSRRDQKGTWWEVRIPGPQTQLSHSVTPWPWETSLGHRLLSYNRGWDKMTSIPLTYLRSKTLKISSKRTRWSHKGGRRGKPYLRSALGHGCISEAPQLGREEAVREGPPWGTGISLTREVSTKALELLSLQMRRLSWGLITLCESIEGLL